MLQEIRNKKKLQLLLGVAFGVCFGFLLQKGGVTRYDIIMGQLLLVDFTVLKIMLTAIAVGMVGIYTMKKFGLVELHPKKGAFGSTVIGGLIFGVGFGVLGYCPGTVAGAAAQGSLDAVFGGILGMFFGAWVYALMFPKLKDGILQKGEFGKVTIPEASGLPVYAVVVIFVAAIGLFLWLIERAGL